MNTQEKKTFAEANEVIHQVENQWHHPIMTAHGFKPITKEAKGFVRKYEYVNDAGYKIVCCTGVSADYFQDPQVTFAQLMAKVDGYLWSKLEPYLKTL